MSESQNYLIDSLNAAFKKLVYWNLGIVKEGIIIVSGQDKLSMPLQDISLPVSGRLHSAHS
jgi:hypothetical protein